MHSNVLGYKDSNRRIFWREVRYAVGCLVAPEFFVGIAAGQWLDARHVSTEVEGFLEAEGAKELGEIKVS